MLTNLHMTQPKKGATQLRWARNRHLRPPRRCGRSEVPWYARESFGQQIRKPMLKEKFLSNAAVKTFPEYWSPVRSDAMTLATSLAPVLRCFCLSQRICSAVYRHLQDVKK